MSERPWIHEAGSGPDNGWAGRTGGTGPDAGTGRQGEQPQLALRLPDWDLVPPTEFVRRRRGEAR
jgi:hypothetical protein